MRSRFLLPLTAILLASLPWLVVDVSGGQDPLDRDPLAPLAEADLPPDGVEPLVRGPVHEAFAQPTDLPPGPGDAVPKAPPEPIPEVPPDMKPEGDNMMFVPGYWAWEPESSQFIWVSGVYRRAPDNRQWVAGHWVRAADGWRWVAGFWAAAGAGEIPYTPEPPATLERGPSLPPPDADSVYVPGVWIYRDTRFLWQPGFYTACQPGRIWINSHYNWSPAGYIFVAGCWDVPFEDRGVLFCPVAFQRPFWNDPLWRYCPSYVVNPRFFQSAFFYNRDHNHFYFGNYYASARGGFHPWWGGPARFDPNYQYYRWQNRNVPNWAADMRLAYADRGAGRRAGPPVSFQQQQAQLARLDKGVNRNLVQVVTPLSRAGADMKLTRLGPAQIEKQKAMGDRSRDFAAFRAKTEVTGGAFPKGGKGEVRSLKLPPMEARLTPQTGDRAFPGKAFRDDKGAPTFPPGKAGKGVGSPFPKNDGAGKTPFVTRDPGTAPKGIGAPKSDLGGKSPGVPRVIGTPKNFDPPRVVLPDPVIGARGKTPGTPKGIGGTQPKGTTDPSRGITPRKFDAPKNPPVTPKNFTPKVDSPKFTPKPRVETPRSVPTPPAPKVIQSPPAPRNPTPVPRTFTPTPRVEAPRTVPTPPAPKVIQSPPPPRNPTPVPRTFTPTPRVSPPKISTPAPRISPPQPTPRSFTPAPRTTPAPRISTPQPVPRSFTPAPRAAPAPRISTPQPAPRSFTPAPRSAPAPRMSTPSPRISSPGRAPGGGGGGSKGGGGGRGGKR